MKNRASNIHKIQGDDLSSVKRSTQKELSGLHQQIIELKNALDTKQSSTRNIEESGPQIRLIKEGSNYYLEAKFEDGWARMATSMDILTKRK